MLRATLKSLLGRKVRLLLSGMAVILGGMFVAGAFVLTDTLGRSFDNLFQNAFTGVDVQVSAKPKIQSNEDRGANGIYLPASLLAQVRAQKGVADATPRVGVDGARVIGSDGKVVSTFGPPRFGVDWPGLSGRVTLRDGHAPTSDDQIVINAGLASTAGLKVGD